jgi:type I restriction enzyme M protein
MANPPFNMKEWNEGVKDDDVRWIRRAAAQGNANFAWMQHMIHHLAPARQHGAAAGQWLDEQQHQQRRRNPQG